MTDMKRSFEEIRKGCLKDSTGLKECNSGFTVMMRESQKEVV